jgi:hypothetical protein
VTGRTGIAGDCPTPDQPDQNRTRPPMTASTPATPPGQPGPDDLIRPHDVRGLTAGELERARRELKASLALVRPDSPTRVPILAHMSAVDAELAKRSAGRAEELPGSPLLP